MSLSDKALAAMGARARSAAPGASFDHLPLSKRSDLDRYPGVIVTAKGHRLAVSPFGKAYLPQVRRDGTWRTVPRPFHDLATLSFHLKVLDGDWPDAILAALDDLPDDPAKCASVPLVSDGPA